MLFAETSPVDAKSAYELLRRMGTEETLLPVLIQLILIIGLARLFSSLFRKLGQPTVVGEILAGIILGPSFLGRFFPGLFETIFHPTGHGEIGVGLTIVIGWVFTILSQIGLILLLFLVGLEFDFGHLRLSGRSALAISLTGLFAPFGLGLLLAIPMHTWIEPHPATGQPVPLVGFALFLGTAMSITAIPILGRLMIELNITQTRIGAVTIAAAAVDDAAGWILLAAVAAIVREQFHWISTLRMIALTVAFGMAMFLVVGPALRRWLRWSIERQKGVLDGNTFAFLLVVLLGCAIVTNLIGIFAIFGAFLLGAVLSAEPTLREVFTQKLRDFVNVFFLPVFFTYTGLRTNIGALESAAGWGMFALVLLVAIGGKFVGCGIAAWKTGFPAREAACIGVMMNTRALMELIVINVGYELRVIPPSVFCMLVLMALLTTVMPTPILMRLMPGTELERWIHQSEFWAAKHSHRQT